MNWFYTAFGVGGFILGYAISSYNTRRQMTMMASVAQMEMVGAMFQQTMRGLIRDMEEPRND